MSVASRARNKKRPTTSLRRHSRFRGEDKGLIPQKRFGLFKANDPKTEGAFGGNANLKRLKLERMKREAQRKERKRRRNIAQN